MAIHSTCAAVVWIPVTPPVYLSYQIKSSPPNQAFINHIALLGLTSAAPQQETAMSQHCTRATQRHPHTSTFSINFVIIDNLQIHKLMVKIVIGAKTLAESLFLPMFALLSVILRPKIHTNHIMYFIRRINNKSTCERIMRCVGEMTSRVSEAGRRGYCVEPAPRISSPPPPPPPFRISSATFCSFTIFLPCISLTSLVNPTKS